MPDEDDTSDTADRISPAQYVEEDFEAELGCTAAQVSRTLMITNNLITF